MPPPFEMPPLTKLERMVLDAGYPSSMGIDQACENVREWMRQEIDRRLREVAKKERVEVVRRVCGSPTDVSQSHAEKLVNGRFALPLCIDCARSPARAAEVDAEIMAFVASVGESAEFAGAVAALR